MRYDHLYGSEVDPTHEDTEQKTNDNSQRHLHLVINGQPLHVRATGIEQSRVAVFVANIPVLLVKARLRRAGEACAGERPISPGTRTNWRFLHCHDRSLDTFSLGLAEGFRSLADSPSPKFKHAVHAKRA